MLRRVAVFHHPKSEGAIAFARQVAIEFERVGIPSAVSSVWDSAAWDCLDGADLLVCIGGDGTVLRAAQVNLGTGIPLLGINMGRLGFLTDTSPREFFDSFERLLAGDWRIEDRAMVRADYMGDGDGPRTFHGLNDVVVSHRSPGRPIYVDLAVDGAQVAVYRCDGIIVATPTGSTGYSLSAGGPILAPTEHHLVVTPVAAHLALGRSLVLQPDSDVQLRVTSDHGAILSVDGQEDIVVPSGVLVDARMSEHVTRFVRFREPSTFYGELAEKLEFQLSSAMNNGA